MSGEKHFKRSPKNPGAVLNTDDRGLEAYRRQKNKLSEINTLKDRVEALEKLILELTGKGNK